MELRCAANRVHLREPLAKRWQESPEVGRASGLERAYDHHAFHEDAEPGDWGHQLGTRRFSSSKKFWTSTNPRGASSSVLLAYGRAIRNRSPSSLTS